MVTRRQYRRRLAVESASLGLGYAAVLVWIGSALVASFSAPNGVPYRPAAPYWPAISGLRTDTAGFLGFGIAAVTLVICQYLRLRRRDSRPPERARTVTRSAGVHLLQAVAGTATVLGTGVVFYLSVSAVTHPETLYIQLSHLAPWPSEGTVRVIGLACCLAGLSIWHYLRASAPRPPEPAAGRERAPGFAEQDRVC